MYYLDILFPKFRGPSEVPQIDRKLSTQQQVMRLAEYHNRFIREEVKDAKRLKVLMDLSTYVLEVLALEAPYKLTSPHNLSNHLSADIILYDKLKEQCWTIIFWCEHRITESNLRSLVR